MFENLKPPVLIIGAPRTGSTVLTGYLGNIPGRTHIPFFVEPHTLGQETVEKFEYWFSQKNCILKIHAYDIKIYKPEIMEYLMYSDEAYRIKIYRKNIVEQIASLYIVRARQNKWYYTKNDTYNDDPIPIDIDAIKHNTSRILIHNKILHETNLNFHEEICYEDLDVGSFDKFVKTPLPKNYTELKEAIQTHLSQLPD